MTPTPLAKPSLRSRYNTTNPHSRALEKLFLPIGTPSFPTPRWKSPCQHDPHPLAKPPPQPRYNTTTPYSRALEKLFLPIGTPYCPTPRWKSPYRHDLHPSCKATPAIPLEPLTLEKPKNSFHFCPSKAPYPALEVETPPPKTPLKPFFACSSPLFFQI